jgi:hypothetical protein
VVLETSTLQIRGSQVSLEYHTAFLTLTCFQ